MLTFLMLIHPFLAADLTVSDLLKYISQAGVLGLLTVMLYGGYKKWWVFGWIYRESEERTTKTEKERDRKSVV